jgi:hypothetical protein
MIDIVFSEIDLPPPTWTGRPPSADARSRRASCSLPPPVLQPDYNFAASFEFGLDLLLDGLEARLAVGG